MNIDERIEVERKKLNKLIEDNANKKDILKQSRKLDKLIVRKIIQEKKK